MTYLAYTLAGGTTFVTKDPSGIGAITDAKVEDFFNKMVEAGVIESDIDWKSAYDTQFVGQGVGMDLK